METCFWFGAAGIVQYQGFENWKQIKVFLVCVEHVHNVGAGRSTTQMWAEAWMVRTADLCSCETEC